MPACSLAHHLGKQSGWGVPKIRVHKTKAAKRSSFPHLIQITMVRRLKSIELFFKKSYARSLKWQEKARTSFPPYYFSFPGWVSFPIKTYHGGIPTRRNTAWRGSFFRSPRHSLSRLSSIRLSTVTSDTLHCAPHTAEIWWNAVCQRLGEFQPTPSCWLDPYRRNVQPALRRVPRPPRP